jgi:hypothetical protein
MEKSDLYKLNKDELILLVCKIQKMLKKELEIKDDILCMAEVKYWRCAHPHCDFFCVKYRYNIMEVSICEKCSICYCSKHNNGRIFANKCITCQYL